MVPAEMRVLTKERNPVGQSGLSENKNNSLSHFIYLTHSSTMAYMAIRLMRVIGIDIRCHWIYQIVILLDNAQAYIWESKELPWKRTLNGLILKREAMGELYGTDVRSREI